MESGYHSKSEADPAPGKRPSAFPWFGLPAKAAASRWWAAGGLMLMMCVMFVPYFAVNEIAAARGVTVFDPEQLFVFDGRSLDSRIPYLPWTVLIYNPLYKGLFWLTVFTYPRTESGARELFQLYSGVIMITLAACVVFILCPAEMTPRVGADYQGGSTPLHYANLQLHGVDRPFNTWPCLHVAQTGLIALAASRWLGWRHWTVDRSALDRLDGLGLQHAHDQAAFYLGHHHRHPACPGLLAMETAKALRRIMCHDNRLTERPRIDSFVTC